MSRRVWQLLPRPGKRFRTYLITLLLLSILCAGGAWILQQMGEDQNSQTSTVQEDAAQVEARLKAIAGWLETTRDWLTADPTLKTALASHSTPRLLSVLSERANEYTSRLPDSLQNVPTDAFSPASNESYAVYSVDGKLQAWRSPMEATFGIDTMLTGSLLLPNRDRAVLLENGPIYAYLMAIRKLVATDGVTEAYIVTKEELATKAPLAAMPPANFLKDFPSHVLRGVRISFGGKPGVAHSDAKWVRKDLFADPADPTSFVGVVSLSRIQQAESSIDYLLLERISTWGFTLAIISFLVWFLFAIAEGTPEPRTSAVRILYSILVLVAIFFARILIAQLGIAGSVMVPNLYQASRFHPNWALGLAASPIELFITSVFATGAAVMLWIVWMPRERLVSRAPARNRTDGRSKPFLMICLGIFLVLLWQILVDGLSFTVESIVRNGSFRYLTSVEIFPKAGMLLMMLSFLGLGVAYLFISVLLLTASLRACIQLIYASATLWKRIVWGAVIAASFLAIGIVLFDSLDLSHTTLLVRIAFAILTFSIAVSVVIVDSFASEVEDGTSFLYKLPRSSRSILFILAVSALIMSPLVADMQLVGNEQTAEKIIEETAEVQTPKLQEGAEHLLQFARNNLEEWVLQGHDTAALHDRAFLIWYEGLREQPQWNASIDLYNSAGVLESHFATLGASNELSRIRPVLDSELVRLRSKQGTADSVPIFESLPVFSSSGGPAIVAGIRTNDTSRNGLPLYALVSLWNSLPAFSSSRTHISILPGANTIDPDVEEEFVIAQYRPNMRRLTNSPAMDVPASVPPDVMNRLIRTDRVWKTTLLHGMRYQTLYEQTAHYYTPGEPPTVIAVSVPIPTFSSTLEFALRLNSVGLVYGILIVIVLLLVRQISVRRFRFTLHFRDRIFLIVIVIALVPLVVVTNVTRNLLAERAQVEEQNRLSRDATAIKDRMMKSIEQTSATINEKIPATATASNYSNSIQNEVEYLSEIVGRDFSIYDASGRLKASSRPELYESSLLSPTLNSWALRQVLAGERSFFTGTVAIGSQRFDVGYQPITSADGSRLLAILSLATMDEQPRIEAEIARTTSFIYGTFAALGLILLAIGALFAARVASPIVQLIRATERIGQGKLSTKVPVTRQDEIGDLMRAFNTMTEELERSREIVAQNERELAWKEMARQVAHEIKNPLTPMKLSVQHLEHAHEAKDPNFNPIFRRVIRTLREQIDVLTRIATEFAHFGAMPRRRWGAVDIRKVADSAVALFDAERNRIRFIVDVPKNLPRVHSDEEELRRAFVNLLRNSVQAMEGWGVVVIRGRSDQGMVNVSVRDTGFGMSDETLKKVFDPNFSTKTSGMGLGLAIVKKTITDMSGTIRVESTPGRGTTFFIDLPARAELGEEE